MMLYTCLADLLVRNNKRFELESLDRLSNKKILSLDTFFCNQNATYSIRQIVFLILIAVDKVQNEYDEFVGISI